MGSEKSPYKKLGLNPRSATCGKSAKRISKQIWIAQLKREGRWKELDKYLGRNNSGVDKY